MIETLEAAPETPVTPTGLPKLVWVAVVVIAINVVLLVAMQFFGQRDYMLRQTQHLSLAQADMSSADDRPSPYGSSDEIARMQKAVSYKPRPAVPILQPAMDWAAATAQAIASEPEADQAAQ